MTIITVSLSSIEAASVNLSSLEKFQLSSTGVKMDGFLKVVYSGIRMTSEKKVTNIKIVNYEKKLTYREKLSAVFEV